MNFTKILVRSFHYYRPYWKRTLFAIILMLVTNALSVLRPWPLAILLDEVIRSGNRSVKIASITPFLSQFFQSLQPTQGLLILALVVVGLQTTWGFFQFWYLWIFVKVGLLALLDLRGEVYGCLQGLSLKFHEARKSGDSIFRVTYDTQAIQTIYNRGFASVITAVVSLLMMFGVMWFCSWKLTLVLMAIMPFLLWAISYFAERVRRETAVVQKEESDVLTRVQEGLTSVRIVHAFGRQRQEVRQFIRECHESFSANLRLTFVNVGSSFVVGLIVALGTALLFYIGGKEVLSGRMTVGTFVLFTSYLVMIYQPLETLSYTGWALASALASAERVFEVLDAPDDVPDRLDAVQLKKVRGTIEFENITFGYHPQHPVLKELNLKVESGETIAVVGGTGSGKSTLLSLIPRFYDPQKGVIRLDERDIRDYTKKSLRAHISMVLQDTMLLTTTVRENIAYGKWRCSEQEIIQAAKDAGAHEFILNLPKGYETEVGERGIRLSGGERQRIGIARAFLKNAPVLLMDEPTGALDVEKEAEIMEAIERLRQGRTTIVVTHRLNIVHHWEKICVLANGRISEAGSGPELLSKGGLYAELWKAFKAKSNF